MKIKKLTEDELTGFQQLPDELKDKPNDSSSELPKSMKDKEDQEDKQQEKNQEEKETSGNLLKKINNYMIKYGDKYSDSKKCRNDVEAWLAKIGF